MYSPRTIKRNSQLYKQNRGVELVRYSVKACREMVQRLDALIDSNSGELTRKLNEKERDFIRNERNLCRIDFVYWLRRYVFIKHRTTDTLVLFDPNIAQKIVLNIWAQLEDAGLAVACICLKARQLGISTLSECAVAHRVQFKKNVNAIIGSSDPGKSTEMSKMVEVCWANQPWWLMPSRTTSKRGELIEFAGMNSGISIQHGSQFTGIGRGTTPSTVHLSEVASFINPEELIDASLIPSFHESEDRFMILESTAEGNTGWWYDSWQQAIQKWPRTLLRPVFLPWFVGKDLYPTTAQSRRNPVPVNWEPAKLTMLHKQKAELYVRKQRDLKRYLGKDWTMPLEQMWWWECERENYKNKKILNKFLQEFCSDDEESFQSSNISAFDTDLVSQLRDETRSEEPVAVFALTSPAISERLYPDRRDIDHEMPTIPIIANWNRTVDKVNFELVPLKFNSYQEDPLGRLYVWEFPQPDTKYVIGVDTSDGIGQDRAIIQVIKLRNVFNPADCDAQVAEFASDNVNSRDLWPMCLAIGTWYTTINNGKLEQIRQVIECNGNGEAVQHDLAKLGWWNFHPWEHYDNYHQQRTNKIGWFTNVRTRQMAVDTLISSLRDGWFRIRSPWFVQEMQTFERNINRQSLRAAFGAHDDRLIMTGAALCSTYIHEITTDGRSFFAAQRKLKRDRDELGAGTVRASELAGELVKETMKRNSPYTGSYNPY